MTTLLCIRCSKPLGPLLLEGETISACPGGHGMWLSRAQMTKLVVDETDDASSEAEATAWASAGFEKAEEIDERFRSCPVCAKTLRKDNWRHGSNVIVDVCDEHGIWVDGGEIERIEAWEEAWATHAAG